jgi:hypothetical protein
MTTPNFRSKYLYVPNSLYGQENYRASRYTDDPSIHINVGNLLGRQQCTCGLVASKLDGNPGHRDAVTGQPLSKALFVTWHFEVESWYGEEETSVSNTRARGLYFRLNCICGKSLGSVDQIVAELPAHNCVIEGFGESYSSPRVRALESLHREVLFELEGIPHLITSHPAKETGGMQMHIFDPSWTLIWGDQIFNRLVESKFLMSGLVSEGLVVVPALVAGSYDGSELNAFALIAKDPDAYDAAYKWLKRRLSERGSDGFTIYRNRMVRQLPVLTPEFNFSTTKEITIFS